MGRAPLVFYTFTFGSMLVFGIALLSTHTVFVQMFVSRGIRVPPDMTLRTECTLVKSRISNNNVAQWDAIVPQAPGVYVLAETSPLAVRSTLAEAERDAAVYPLNASYPCVCPETNFHFPCLLDLQVFQYLQQEAARYGYAEATLIGVGICTLLFSTAGLTMLVWHTECFWACQKRVAAATRDFYRMESDQDPQRSFNAHL